MSRSLRPGGALFALVSLLIGAHAASAQTLPAGWTNRDIGSPAITGSAESSSGTITIRGAGIDVWDSHDQFHFAYQQVSGDVDIRVRVDSVEDVHWWTKAGVMIRESLNGESRHAFMLVSRGSGLAFQRRPTTGGESEHTDGGFESAPAWVRLIRKGNQFEAYRSSNGTSWTLVGSITLSMPATTYVGLAVTSHDASRAATARFSNLQVNAAASLPAPWTARDLGNPALAGRASLTGDTFSVTGAGEDIWGESDQFHFVYQPFSGDVDVIAQVTSLEHADVWSKAGVMIREALTGPAAHAYMLASAARGGAFQRRLQAGGTSYHSPGGGSGAPLWLRLVREGKLFTAYESHDGSSWKVVGTDTIAMPSTVYVGLAVTSHNTGARVTGTFRSVTVSKPTNANRPPTVSITSPTSGASFNAPATITINATASDVDGSVARVDFFQGTTLIASDTTSPYSVTWSNVPAGFYSLTAVARDNEGAIQTSAGVNVSVTVSAPSTSRATTLFFEPSTNHATNVSSYTVELRRAGDPLTVSPMAARNLGKPAIVNGEIAVDISTLVDPLPSGSYYGVVIAIGPGGSTPSAPSATFSK